VTTDDKRRPWDPFPWNPHWRKVSERFVRALRFEAQGERDVEDQGSLCMDAAARPGFTVGALSFRARARFLAGAGFIQALDSPLVREGRNPAALGQVRM